jgi:hypothetical protein
MTQTETMDRVALGLIRSALKLTNRCISSRIQSINFRYVYTGKSSVCRQCAAALIAYSYRTMQIKNGKLWRWLWLWVDFLSPESPVQWPCQVNAIAAKSISLDTVVRLVTFELPEHCRGSNRQTSTTTQMVSYAPSQEIFVGSRWRHAWPYLYRHRQRLGDPANRE